MLLRPKPSLINRLWNWILAFLGFEASPQLQTVIARPTSLPLEDSSIDFHSSRRLTQTPALRKAPQKLPLADRPNILVFEDSNLLQMFWEKAQDDQKLSNMYRFRSWEEFLANPLSKERLRGAAAFVDHDYKDEKSAFNGINIAEKLIELGVAKIYSTTSLEEYIRGYDHLFDAWIGKNIPPDIMHFVKKKFSILFERNP